MSMAQANKRASEAAHDMMIWAVSEGTRGPDRDDTT